MWRNIVKRIKTVVEPVNEQAKLENFIAAQHPTSVAEVEHWTKIYDQRQHEQRSNNFFNYTV